MKLLNKRYNPHVPVGRIKPNPRNVNEGAQSSIAESIAENGFYGACIVNERTGYLVAGEHRWKAAKAEGAKTVPVLYIDCDEETERKLLLADNQTTRLGGFDMGALIEELEAIKSDYGSLAGTGFDDAALAKAAEDLANDKPESDRVQREVIEGPNATVCSANGPKETAACEELPERFQVLVKCQGEAQQTEVLELLQEKGYDCRALVA